MYQVSTIYINYQNSSAANQTTLSSSFGSKFMLTGANLSIVTQVK